MANGHRPISLGELSRQIDKADRATDERFNTLEKSIDERFKRIEDTLRWIGRSIAALMFTVIGAILIAYLTRQV